MSSLSLSVGNLESQADCARDEVDGPDTGVSVVPVRRSFFQRWQRHFAALALKRAVKAFKDNRPRLGITILRSLAELAPSEPVIRIVMARWAVRFGEEADARIVLSRPFDSPIGQQRLSSYFRRMGGVYSELLDFQEALRCLEEARALSPSSSAVYEMLGRHCLEANDDIDGAVRYFEEQIRHLPPECAGDAVRQIAQAFQSAGRREEAIAAYRRMLDFPSYAPFAHAQVSEIQNDKDPEAPLALEMRSQLRSPAVSMTAKAAMHFRLGDIYDAHGDAATAFAHFSAGHEIRSRMPSFAESDDWPAYDVIVDAIPTVFDESMFSKLSSHGCDEDFLICVVGMPRSGTTLAERILGSHSEIAGLGERGEFMTLARTLPVRMKSRKPFPDCCRQLSPAQISSFALRIRDRFRALSRGRRKVVTKLPFDCFLIGLIKILFPKATIVHCRRNPLDTCLSCYMQDFEQLMFPNDLRRMADVYRRYRRVMQYWSDILPPDSVFELRYESLVDDPESLVRELCAHCGVDFEPACLAFHRRPGTVQTASHWQVRRPIYRESMNRSERYREFLGPLLQLDLEELCAQQQDVQE